jgi:AraC family transcriptional regulator
MTAREPTAPQFPSTHLIERATGTPPILSSREAGWENIAVSTYSMPFENGRTRVPTIPDIHLVLIEQGALYVESRDEDGLLEKVHARPGDLFLTPGGSVPYEVSWRTLSPEPIQSLQVHLNADLFARTTAQMMQDDLAHLKLPALSGFRDPLLTQIALALPRALAQAAPTGRLYADAAAQMLAVHLLSHYLAARAPLQIQDSTQGLTHRQITQLTDYLLAHLHTSLSLETLAQQVGLSAYHFAHLFRKTTGETPHQFVIRTRLETAQRLLKETNWPLSQVALSVGFQSQSHFTQVFNERLGETPRQYRQTHGKSTSVPHFSTKNSTRK